MTGASGPAVDLATVRALAHPLRQQILERLQGGDAANSTTLAKQLGVTTGATSYNLRILAKHGFVEEVPGRGRGRERWWRSAPSDVRFAPQSQQSDEMRQALDVMHRLWLAADVDLLARFSRHQEGMGEWADAVPYSRGGIRVTVGELQAFFDEYVALLKRYTRPPDDATPGVRNVATRFIAVPVPDDPPDASPDASPEDAGGRAEHEQGSPP